MGAKTYEDILPICPYLFELNKYVGLNLAVGFDADRTSKIYSNYVSPNILIQDGDDFENLKKDQKIITAIKWLSQAGNNK